MEIFAFPTGFAHYPNLDLFSLWTHIIQVTRCFAADSSCGTTCLGSDMEWQHLLVRAAGYRSLLIAEETVGILRGRDCGRQVILEVEAVLSRGVIDQRVLTATSMQMLGSYPVWGEELAR